MQPENSHVAAAHHAGGSLALDEAESNGLTEEQLLEVFRRTSFLAKRHKRPQTTSKRASRKWHDDRDSDEMEEDMLDQLGRLVHQTDTQPGQSFPANDLGESTSPSVSDETPGRESDSSNDDAETPRRRVKWGSGSSPSPQAVGQKRNLKMIKHGSVDQQARASGSATHLAPLHTATNLSTASAVPVVRTPKIEKHTATAGPKKIDRRTLLDKYKDYQDTSGNRMSLKRKSKSTDPTLPVYMRLTPGPLPPWVLEIGTFREQAPGARWLVADILRSNLAELTGQTFEGILIDAPLARSGEPATPGMVTVDELKAAGISPALIPRGFIFMWAEKEWIPDLLEVAQAWGFHYVENICWVRHNINNKVSREDSRFFRKSKLLLLIFRNFDIGAKQVAIPEEKPQPIYSTIETLLPNANATALPDGSIGPGKLLELSWRAQPFLRRGWTTISHSQSLAITGPFHYSANQASHALYRNPNHMEAVHRGLFSQHVESAVPTTLTGPPSSSDPSKVEQP
ncbi:hypothetical protein CAOG_07090 [Capsaspora owczarzaki ATCC 30864]|uniref:hypothetical protein n=1 Tax=Capsaspora owczarzaki (strain ATCC 30864) TaxID=595528 RepID=UPI0001FE3034|nr:hypothetical protein CAOG_07090 [Capsaspora owczarzaki ATCC 30864]|eukprot:XP_004343814.1 hypothetical protein CAOG_07090 [Capsaspora owczarzaki ATCC 30864]